MFTDKSSVNVGFNPRLFLFERLLRLLDGVLFEGVESSQRQAAAATELHKKEADHNHHMFLAPFDLLVAVDPMVGANMARGPWAAYAAGSLSSTHA